MTNQDYIKVFSGSFIMVQLVKQRLEDAGINAIIKDESESGRLAGFGASIQGFQELYVSDEELTKAKPIIDTVRNELEANQ
ncbi:DUF2007 domain-containing protein [Psychroserpens sp. XS_ASV72]|uniref:putative signal transducing protein n=1 Tax=Psychroserpens sp. XS_ASV72 TaxID=3241293 RepID=UPI003516771E